MITGDIVIVITGGPFLERMGPVHRNATEPVTALNRYLGIFRFRVGIQLYIIELPRYRGYLTGV